MSAKTKKPLPNKKKKNQKKRKKVNNEKLKHVHMCIAYFKCP